MQKEFISKKSTSEIPIIFDVTAESDNTPEPTLLGDIRPNPFDVQVLSTAYNQLYEPGISEMEVTDLYVKFTPQTEEAFNEIIQLEEELYDYDLLREVIQMGDYNPDFDYNNPVLYAVVPSDFIFPNEDYIVLSELHLNRQIQIYTNKPLQI